MLYILQRMYFMFIHEITKSFVLTIIIYSISRGHVEAIRQGFLKTMLILFGIREYKFSCGE